MSETQTEPASVENEQLEVSEKPEISAPEPRKFKVKVDGIESEVHEEELVRSYQKSQSADKRFSEAAELRKQLETFVENVRANPSLLLQELGHDPKQWARQLVLQEIEEEEQAKDPNMRRIASLEKKLQEFETLESRKRSQEAEQLAQQQEMEILSKLDSGISSALEEMGFSSGNVPAELVCDVAEQMLAEYKLSKKQLEPREALSRAKQSYSKRISAITKSNPEAILEFIPPEYLDKIAEAYMKKRQPKSTPNVKSATPTIGSVKEKHLSDLENFFKRKN